MSLANKKLDINPVLICGAGRVKQEFAKRSDIREIVARYRRTGMLDHVAKARPAFADVSQVGDFRQVWSRLRAAEESFEQLPATVRKRFNNRAVELVEFIQDDVNYDEAVKLGLVLKKEPAPEPAPQKVHVVRDDRGGEDPEDPPAPRSRKK